VRACAACMSACVSACMGSAGEQVSGACQARDA
jgi:hypothetical protein